MVWILLTIIETSKIVSFFEIAKKKVYFNCDYILIHCFLTKKRVNFSIHPNILKSVYFEWSIVP